jgi:NAD(P)H-dependent FMN reductase
MHGQQKLFIPILLGSARLGRRSIHVARLIHTQLESFSGIETELLDLAEYAFPIMQERPGSSNQYPTPPGLADFSGKAVSAQGLVIVAPEYKNGYPGVLKNALDYLEPNIFCRKPIGITTVSSGKHGGLNCLWQLRQVCLAMGGFPIPVPLTVSSVSEVFDEKGVLLDLEFVPRLKRFLDELIWYSSAMKQQSLL